MPPPPKKEVNKVAKRLHQRVDLFTLIVWDLFTTLDH